VSGVRPLRALIDEFQLSAIASGILVGSEAATDEPFHFAQWKPIFRGIRGSLVAEPYEPQVVRAIVKRRAAMAGTQGDYSVHSLRSGFMTEAGCQDVPLGEATALLGPSQRANRGTIFQAGAVDEISAGKLLGSGSAEAG
jgi:hypothetical protein